MGGDLVRKGVPEVVTLELRSAKQTREKVVFSTKLSCQGSVLGGGLRAEIAQAERKLEGREEDYDVDVAGKKAGPAGLCRTEELCLHPNGHGTEMGAQQSAARCPGRGGAAQGTARMGCGLE